MLAVALIGAVGVDIGLRLHTPDEGRDAFKANQEWFQTASNFCWGLNETLGPGHPDGATFTMHDLPNLCLTGTISNSTPSKLLGFICDVAVSFTEPLTISQTMEETVVQERIYIAVDVFPHESRVFSVYDKQGKSDILKSLVRVKGAHYHGWQLISVIPQQEAGIKDSILQGYGVTSRWSEK